MQWNTTHNTEEETTVTHNTMNLKNIMLGERSQTHKGTFIKV